METEPEARSVRVEAPVGLWKPIDTAPKDGTLIDVWLSTGKRICDVRYIAPGAGRFPWRWWCDDVGFGYIDGGGVTLTHWMPRPAPPNAQAKPTFCPHENSDE